MGFGRWMQALGFPAAAARRTMFGNFPCTRASGLCFAALLLKACWAQPLPMTCFTARLASWGAGLACGWTSIWIRLGGARLEACTDERSSTFTSSRMHSCRARCSKWCTACLGPARCCLIAPQHTPGVVRRTCAGVGAAVHAAGRLSAAHADDIGPGGWSHSGLSSRLDGAHPGLVARVA